MLKTIDRFADWIAFILFEEHHGGSGFHELQPASLAAKFATAGALAAVVALITVLLVLGLDAVLDLTPFSMLGI